MSATAIEQNGVSKTMVNALILYDDLDCAANANAALDRASNRTELAVQCCVKPWRLDLLDLLPTQPEALSDAADAHLIVVAVRSQADFSSSLLGWLETWAARRHVQDAALAVFDGGAGGWASAATSPTLARLAQRHGLSFIDSEDGWARNDSVVVTRDLHERGTVETPTLRHTVDRPVYDRFRSWGINE